MDFSILFYETAESRCPVQEFLDELERSAPDDFAIVAAGLAKMRQRAYHRPPLSKAIGDGLYELRHVGKLNTQVLYFFVIDCRVVLVHGIRNKARRIPPRDRRVALARKADWQARNA